MAISIHTNVFAANIHMKYDIIKTKVIMQTRNYVTLYNNDKIPEKNKNFVTNDFAPQNENNLDVFFLNTGESAVNVTLFKKGLFNAKAKINSFEVKPQEYIAKEIPYISSESFYLELDSESEISGHLRVRQFEN